MLFLFDVNERVFFDNFLKDTRIRNFLNIHSVGAACGQTDRRTDGHDKTNSHFSQFCKYVLKKLKPINITYNRTHNILQGHIVQFKAYGFCIKLWNLLWNLEVRKPEHSVLKPVLITHFNTVFRPFLTGSDES